MCTLGFPQKFVNWTMASVTFVTYRFSISGEPSDILQAKKGLRQGDPISPLLFILIMKYFHRVMQGLEDIPNFNFHPKCERLKIVNICFADDILLFSMGDIVSIRLIMRKVREFS